MGGTSTASKPEEPLKASEDDKRAAAAAGMTLKDYLKYSTKMEDSIPL
jgi:hypothetical protein